MAVVVPLITPIVPFTGRATQRPAAGRNISRGPKRVLRLERQKVVDEVAPARAVSGYVSREYLSRQLLLEHDQC